MVGNSYAVSIPRQIVDFIKEQEKVMNNMVSLCFDDPFKLSLNFAPGKNSRIVQSEEVKVVRNNKPIFHKKRFYDSADPKKSKTRIIKNLNHKKQVDKELEGDR